VRLRCGDDFSVDAWAFERAARRRDDPLTTALDYAGDVLSEQFAYDDTVEAYRTRLRRTFLGLARAALRTEPTGDEVGWTDQRAELVRLVERCAPDEATWTS
jgi:hypothetical protein